MKIKDIFGFHSAFYYFGYNHLCINMNNYINSGLKGGEFVILLIGDNLYNYIKNGTNINDKNSMCIQNFNKIVDLYKSLGRDGIQRILNQYQCKAIKSGYSGLRFIIDVSNFISMTSKNDFLDVDFSITSIIANSKSSVICAYDFEDYVNRKKFIDDEIIEKSYQTHPYRLYMGKVVPLAQLCTV
ncbi:MEDS domain-containing protein [Clostridium sp.]|jgi:hypothetical protein|uniref:MEDS domain-containing protein n=1 Tax=Clostridium sp. TaxID=1506 RepID=UPI003A5BDD7A